MGYLRAGMIDLLKLLGGSLVASSECSDHGRPAKPTSNVKNAAPQMVAPPSAASTIAASRAMTAAAAEYGSASVPCPRIAGRRCSPGPTVWSGDGQHHTPSGAPTYIARARLNVMQRSCDNVYVGLAGDYVSRLTLTGL
jgi:hypothetical protein